MKISIVTISFNQARFLEACIQSVLNQNYGDIEYIIVDPGSSDGSREIIKRHSDSFSHILFEKDEGPADGLNKGFSYATGDIFCYINSDDIFLPGAFQTVANYFSRLSKKVDVIYGNGLYINATNEVVEKMFSSYFSLRRLALGACSVIQQATFFKQESFHKTNGFSVDNRTCWDRELLVDLAIAGARFKHVPESLGCFRIYNESSSGSGISNPKYYQYLIDSRRISDRILGRPPAMYDPLMKGIYHLDKYLRHPMTTSYKLGKLFGINLG
ncbi:MAG: hypothetical protein BWK78_01140 [Thiotrichaceae bacterium IS1]|nr:MAG: hypothetical protein BWK78_01140 [Thiotrichaceae bacterium IS1]